MTRSTVTCCGAWNRVSLSVTTGSARPAMTTRTSKSAADLPDSAASSYVTTYRPSAPVRAVPRSFLPATDRSHASTSSPTAATPAASVTTPCTDSSPAPGVGSAFRGRTITETTSSGLRPLHSPAPLTVYTSRFGPVTRNPTSSPSVTSTLKRRGFTANSKAPSAFVCAIPRLSEARFVNASTVKPGTGRRLRSSNTRPLMEFAIVTLLDSQLPGCTASAAR